MDRLLELLLDTSSPLGRLVTTVVLVAAVLPVAALLGRLVARRGDDAYSRYYLRKGTRYLVFLLLLVAIALLLDITPLRAKVLEIGSGKDETSWVRGRQYTGRTVSISNKAVFSEPVYNSSVTFDYLWEELTVPVPYDGNWQLAEGILREEAQRASSSTGAREAIEAMRRRYPVGRAEVEPRVFVQATDNWVELSARFVVQVRAARSVKDEVTRRVLSRFAEDGITVASATQDITVRHPSADPRAEV